MSCKIYGKYIFAFVQIIVIWIFFITLHNDAKNHNFPKKATLLAKHKIYYLAKNMQNIYIFFFDDEGKYEPYVVVPSMCARHTADSRLAVLMTYRHFTVEETRLILHLYMFFSVLWCLFVVLVGFQTAYLERIVGRACSLTSAINTVIRENPLALSLSLSLARSLSLHAGGCCDPGSDSVLK